MFKVLLQMKNQLCLFLNGKHATKPLLAYFLNLADGRNSRWTSCDFAPIGNGFLSHRFISTQVDLLG